MSNENILKKELQNYKKYTLELIESAEKDDYDTFTNILDRRQSIINEINKLCYCDKEFQQICFQLGIVSLEKELNELMLKNKQELKSKINKIKKSQKAHNSYNSNFINKSYFIKRDI
jgi:flagellar protein FliT